jgi:putative transposase
VLGTGGEGAKYWLQVQTEIKNRGTKDVCIVVSDGLTGMTESISATWPEAIHQTCVLHLIRNTFRHASKADWPAIWSTLTSRNWDVSLTEVAGASTAEF